MRDALGGAAEELAGDAQKLKAKQQEFKAQRDAEQARQAWAQTKDESTVDATLEAFKTIMDATRDLAWYAAYSEFKQDVDAYALARYEKNLARWISENDSWTDRKTVGAIILTVTGLGTEGLLDETNVRLLKPAVRICELAGDGYYMNEHGACGLERQGQGLMCVFGEKKKIYLDPAVLYGGNDSLYAYLKTIDGNLEKKAKRFPVTGALQGHIARMKKDVDTAKKCITAVMERQQKSSAQQ